MVESGCIEVPQRKIIKLLGYISEMKRSSRTTRRHFEKLIGLAMWLTQLWPYMRIWIRHWYSDLYAIPATHFSIDYGDGTSWYPASMKTRHFGNAHKEQLFQLGAPCSPSGINQYLRYRIFMHCGYQTNVFGCEFETHRQTAGTFQRHHSVF